jgi:hypothetical protein
MVIQKDSWVLEKDVQMGKKQFCSSSGGKEFE